jgi:curli biogenesis system outer membrane secretion channel CsgG
MKTHRPSSLIVALLLAVVYGHAAAQEDLPAEPPVDETIYAAILDFDVSLPDSEDLGPQIADILTARLSIEDGFELVERAKLAEILAEQKLTLSGLVDSNQAVQIGKLTGAKLLIMGRAFKIDKKLMIVTKIIGVETSRVKGTLLQVDLADPLSDALMALSEDVAAMIRDNADKLLPEDLALADPVGEAREALATKALPTVAVVIPEEHLARVVMDPAVETEIKMILADAGITLVDIGRNELADWARKQIRGEQTPWPDGLADADYVIVGEGFSELAGRVSDLVSVVGRAEINVIDRHTGEIVLADREGQRAIDLAEVNAGKTALQKTGRLLGIRLLDYFVESLPDAPPVDDEVDEVDDGE